MITSPNMGLIIWNSSTDSYNSEEQAENWAKVDQHDHTPGKGARITTGAIADAAITAEKLAPGAIPQFTITDGSITSGKLASNAVTTTKILNGSVTDSKLASPVGGAYRTIFHSTTLLKPSTTAGAYALGLNLWTRGGLGTLLGNTPLENAFLPTFYYSGADYAVPNKSIKLRIRAQIITGNAPGTNFTVNLYKPNASSNNLSYDAGFTSPSAGVTFTSPGANSELQGVSADFDPPANGIYGFLVTVQGTTAGTALLSAQLQLHHV